MIDKVKRYYNRMLSNDRLLPIIVNNRLAGFITYYILKNTDDYFKSDDPYYIIQDDPIKGTICYIDHLVTDKEKENPKLSYLAWRNFKNFIKHRYPHVTKIVHNRFKGGKINVYNTIIDKRRVR